MPRSYSVLARDEKIRSHYLLEASAGTGKTFTVENLVIRFLLEEPRLTIREILLVTFTRAATRELKQRISQQIDRTLDILHHKKTAEAPDYLLPWMEDEGKLRGAKRALQDALASFDEAQIFTIHSFCEKMLKEYGDSHDIHLSQGQVSPKTLLELIHNYYRLVQSQGLDENRFTSEQLNILLKRYKQDINQLDQALLQLIKRSTPIETPTSCSDDPLHILAFMASDLQKIVKKYLEEEEKYRFDDLLEAMAKSLSSAKFTDSVGALYKAVVIDEFQDTDSLQWNIFRTLFHNPSCCLYLVGDPKQSIYAFRQADIYTYLSASKELGEDCCATLDTNYRSLPMLVKALNAFFSGSPDLISLPTHNSFLPFHSVNAGVSIEQPFSDDETQSMHCWVMGNDLKRKKNWPTEEMEESAIFPTLCQEMIRLHRSFGIAWHRWAILVKDRYQGRRLLEFLQEQGVPAVTQREESLLDSKALPIFKELMQAVVHPRNESFVKTALFSPLFNLSLEDFDLEEGVEKFLRWRSLFYDGGIASMFANILSSRWRERQTTLAEDLLQLEEGEFLFRDLRQIVDILSQYENNSKATPQQMINYLDHFEDLELIDEETTKIRQDLEKGAVNILTMHMSKGLEFDFVICLAAASRSKTYKDLIPINQQGTIKLIPYDAEDPVATAYARELEAEKIRQLYVGMTRAKVRLYLPILIQTDQKKNLELGIASPLELYFQKVLRCQTFTVEKIEQYLLTIPHLSVSHFIDAAEKIGQEIVPLLPPEKIELLIKKKKISSFSLLSKSSYETPRSLTPPHDFEASEKNRHTLPAGIETGLLLHNLLETIPFSLMKKASVPKDLYPFLDQQLQNSAFSSWRKVIAEMLWNVFTTPLPPFGLVLRDVEEKNTFREIEFIFDSSKSHPHHDHQYLKGVIDLIFMYEGKYYIADWKSNWLGEDIAAYSRQSLQEAMEDHQYLLQAQIYQEALRRYVSLFDNRDFTESFGGAYYIFLRGIDPKNQQGIFLDSFKY